jgi:Skp family chaperone for outer membrane proteins
MTYTKNLRALEKERDRLRQALTAADDELLELRDRDKRLAEIEAEHDHDDDQLAARYRMGN